MDLVFFKCWYVHRLPFANEVFFSEVGLSMQFGMKRQYQKRNLIEGLG